MDQLLDIDEIISENKRQENNRLSLFESILVQCHALIKRNNKDRIREMTYKIPAFVYGKPKFDIDVLRNYLIHHLRDNGLRVDIIDRYHIYVSWKETDIDLNRYMQRKTVIHTRHNSSRVLDNGTGPLSSPSDRYEMMKFRQNKQRLMGKNLPPSRFDILKFRQQQQQKIKHERSNRFKMQQQQFIPSNQNFEDYIKKY
jgi:hypothetical protein